MISIHISYPHNSFLTQTYTEYDAKITVKGVSKQLIGSQKYLQSPTIEI